MKYLKRKTEFIQLILLAVAGLVAPVRAQSQAVQVLGRVIDQNRAVVSGASVTAKQVTSGASLSVVTDDSGEFNLSLPSGEYTLEVAANGFTAVSKAFDFKTKDNESIEIVLRVAGATAVVTVGASDAYTIDIVSSATKTPTALIDVPQSVATVSKEQINDQMLQSIGDILRYTPGVSVHQGENNRDQFILRGQSSSADFFLNGVRDDVQYYRDPYNLERLETLKGPNAMIFGRGGGGGVVNRVTKEPSFAPSREITVQGGSFYNRRVTADINQPINEKAAFRVNGVYENSNSFRRYVNLNRLAFNPTFTFNPTGTTRFAVGYEYARDRRAADRGITSFQGRPANVPVNTFYGNPDDTKVRSDVNILSGTFDQQLGKFAIHNRTSYGDYDRYYQNYVPGASNAAGTLVALSAYNNATKRRNLFNQTDVTVLFSTGPLKHTIVGGAEFGRQLTTNIRKTGFFNNSATSLQVAFNNPITAVPVTFRQSATDADNHLTTNLAATYVQDQIELNRFVQVLAGVRYDYFGLRYHNNRNDSTLRRTDSLVSPRFGLIVKPILNLSLYGSYAVSYLPSSGDQFSSLTTITEQVKPEKFTNYEAGVKWQIRPTLSFTSAVYRLNRTNTRSIDPNNPAAIIQTGSQRTSGFEVGLAGNILPRWSVSGGYAYQHALITSATTVAVAGRRVAQVPRNSFTLWNKYQVTSKFGLGFGLINRASMFAGIDNTVSLPGYTRVDGAAYYTINEHWRIQANMENALNKRYVLNADGNTNISPGSPRALKLGVVARF